MQETKMGKERELEEVGENKLEKWTESRRKKERERER